MTKKVATTDTLIGAGKSLDDLKIGLDAVVLNEHRHWFREEGGRLYAKARISKENGEFRLYITGEAEKGLSREKY